MQFSRREYVGSEGGGFLSVEVVLSGGISSGPFNVTVNPSELFPPIAIGQFILNLLHFTTLYDDILCCLIVSCRKWNRF